MSNILAERSIIGSLLMDASCIDRISTIVEPYMFQNELLGSIYAEFLKGYENNYSVTMVTLVQKLESDLYTQEILMKLFYECTDEVVTTATAEASARALLNEYKTRRANKILNSIKLSPAEINEQIGAILNELGALNENRKTTIAALPEIVGRYKGQYFTDTGKPKNYLGFDKLDDIVGGLEGGDIIIVGARPSVGKSAFATQIAENLASAGKKVGYYNLEMSNKQMYERFVVAKSGIGLTRLKRAKQFLGDEKERFERANAELEKQDGVFIAEGSKTVSEIRSESRHMGYDVLVIDYLQLIRSDAGYKGNRYAEVGAISREIKALAMELGIPVVLLSQLNRVSEMREAKEPSMAELRESGDIEQDASVIILLWNITEDKSKKGCKVEKNRQGKLGKVVMDFNGDLMKFIETDETIKQASGWKKADEESTPFD